MKWITNCHISQAAKIKSELLMGNLGRVIIEGKPKETDYSSVSELESMKVIGLYDIGV